MSDAPIEREKSPSLLKAMVFLLLMAAVGGALFVFVLTQRSQEGPKVVTAAPAPLLVETVPVHLSGAFTLEEKFSGLVAARRTSALGFQSGGRIADIRVDVGDRVKARQTLAVLDTRGLQAQLVAAEAVVEEARAGHALAEATARRQRVLLGKGHVSKQAVDEAEAQADTAFARIEAAKASADALRVSIDLARIEAPFAGAVTQRYADEGAIATPGAPVIELVETGALEARIGLPAELAAELEAGKAYTLLSDKGPVGAVLKATTGVIDTQRRTVTSVFEITDADVAPAGSVVRIALPRQIEERGVWAPFTALTEASRGLWSVYVAAPSGGGYVAEKRLVEVVQAEDDRVFIRGAVEEGERMIVTGLGRIAPGQPVRVKDAPLAELGRGS